MIATLTHDGKMLITQGQRPEQQDAGGIVVSNTDGLTYAYLIDGMGGERNGRQATLAAETAVIDAIHASTPLPEIFRLADDAAATAQGYATLIVARKNEDSTVTIANVGDSYAFDADHNLLVTPHEAPGWGTVLRYIGGDNVYYPDVLDIPSGPVYLASDGIDYFTVGHQLIHLVQDQDDLTPYRTDSRKTQTCDNTTIVILE